MKETNLTEEQVEEICILPESINELMVEANLTIKTMSRDDLQALFSQMEAGKMRKEDFFEIAERYSKYHSHLNYIDAAKRIPKSIATIRARMKARREDENFKLS